MNYSVVICAAGSGTRMKLGYNKVYAKLDDDRTILDTTISCFLNDEECKQIVVVTDSEEFMKEHAYHLNGKVTLAKGGSSRQESVCNGLSCVSQEYVMIHDGARPFLKKESIEAIKQTLEVEDACLLMVPSKDTIKKVVNGYVVETYDRSTLMNAQTPQAFKTELILKCMKLAIQEGYTGTDDASLVEKYSNVKVKVVEGDYENIKITTPEDLKK